MSSPLDKSHPFRESIDRGAPVSSEESGSVLRDKAFTNDSALEDVDSKFGQAIKRLKTMGKVALGCGLCVLAFYLYFGLRGVLHGEEEVVLAADPSMEDEFDLHGGRTVDEARQSISIFSRLFCKGGRRSTFCD